ncbi:MAG TPA: hypothetical protein VFI70_09510, partial [Nitrososphaeraceae archaeon]|nr:hypothetical protein [Nitrososphaeraceae archaeon]
KIAITDTLYNLVTALLEPTTVKEKEHSKEQKQQQQMVYYDLSSEIIQTSISFFKPYYVEGYRHEFTLSFSGFAFYCHMSKESTSRILSGLADSTNDNEINDRLETLDSTYKKGENGESITGAPTLVELIAKIANYDDLNKAQRKMNSLKMLWSEDIDISNLNNNNNNAGVNDTGTTTNDDNNILVISVSDAKMYNDEHHVKVRGKIMSCGGSFKMVSARV